MQDKTIFTPDVVFEDSVGQELDNEISHIYHGSLLGGGMLL